MHVYFGNYYVTLFLCVNIDFHCLYAWLLRFCKRSQHSVMLVVVLFGVSVGCVCNLFASVDACCSCVGLVAPCVLRQFWSFQFDQSIKHVQIGVLRTTTCALSTWAASCAAVCGCRSAGQLQPMWCAAPLLRGLTRFQRTCGKYMAWHGSSFREALILTTGRGTPSSGYRKT